MRTTFLVENSVVELRNGDLYMLFRTHDTGFLYSATSSNKGFDWTEPAPSDLQNPDSKAQVSTEPPLTKAAGALVYGGKRHRPCVWRLCTRTSW